MARKPDEAKRREIADGALRVLRERGIHGTTMSQIASDLGMKRPTLYWYFAEVSEIFEYSIRRHREEETAYIVARVQGISHPLDLLEAIIRAEVDFHAEHGLEEYVLLLVQSLGAGDANSRERFRKVSFEQLAPLRQMLVGAVTLGIQQGLIAPCHPANLVDFMFVVLDGTIVHSIVSGADVSGLYDFVHDTVIAPLRREPGEGSEP